jgi:hypothetical protein
MWRDEYLEKPADGGLFKLPTRERIQMLAVTNDAC